MKLEIEITTAQHKELKAVAKAAGISMSEWLLTSLSGDYYDDAPDCLHEFDAKMAKIYAEMHQPNTRP